MPHLSATAIRKVKDGTVFTTDVTKVGEVYFKLAKYMLRVKPTLFLKKKKETVKFFCSSNHKSLNFFHVLLKRNA
jgi:hypothetical protein